MRLFVALPIPDAIALRLTMLQAGVPGAHWQSREQMHLTLRFIGEIDGAALHDIDSMLAGLDVPAFSLRLKAVGEFGHDKPGALWAGVETSDALLHLQRKIERAIQQAGLPAEKQKFVPHVTLAYLRGTPVGSVLDYLTDHARFASESFVASQFLLYSSQLTGNGSKYRVERAYGLS